ncbi:Mbov_0400 family ICE element protein [[Mycoplasma] gypis]|uniref:Uncharacterized protein n=1 Tax=[Mycoplasma] gypis TaxID=92404 RepID=A0ABZ2RUW4_9BACT|nr:hypothetical protein [[Mycoplasma] gypis]MBN0919379.1 hypothetical protein [[Mycoplasma] gypis]
MKIKWGLTPFAKKQKIYLVSHDNKGKIIVGHQSYHNVRPVIVFVNGDNVYFLNCRSTVKKGVKRKTQKNEIEIWNWKTNKSNYVDLSNIQAMNKNDFQKIFKNDSENISDLKTENGMLLMEKLCEQILGDNFLTTLQELRLVNGKMITSNVIFRDTDLVNKTKSKELDFLFKGAKEYQQLSDVGKKWYVNDLSLDKFFEQIYTNDLLDIHDEVNSSPELKDELALILLNSKEKNYHGFNKKISDTYNTKNIYEINTEMLEKNNYQHEKIIDLVISNPADKVKQYIDFLFELQQDKMYEKYLKEELETKMIERNILENSESKREIKQNKEALEEENEQIFTL